MNFWMAVLIDVKITYSGLVGYIVMIFPLGIRTKMLKYVPFEILENDFH